MLMLERVKFVGAFGLVSHRSQQRRRHYAPMDDMRMGVQDLCMIGVQSWDTVFKWTCA